MAQYRFSAQVIKRSDGRSAVAAAAYRSGERLIDERLDMPFDFEKRGGVEHTEIMAPEGAPESFNDRAALWNAVEAAEVRADAQVAREVQVSLPHEMTFEQRQELVREFVQEAFVSKGMVADVAMHTPDPEGDQRNYHAHIMLTTRQIEGEGFGKKERDWNSNAQLKEWREQRGGYTEPPSGKGARTRCPEGDAQEPTGSRQSARSDNPPWTYGERDRAQGRA